jgi:hypothetical protein
MVANAPDKPDGLVEVTEYRVSISGRGGGLGTRSITVTFQGFDARHDGQGDECATVREAVEYMLPPAHRAGRMSRTERLKIQK